VDRRAFLALVPGSLLAAPLAVEAQPAAKVYRIGWLSPFSEPPATFREALRELGYVDGKTFAFEIRNAQGSYARLPGLASELMDSKVDIIVAVAPAAIQAAKEATSSIPIVMRYWGGPDLLGSGVVASFNRPGGNVTGVYMIGSDLNPKRLELLKQVVPAARKVAVLVQGTYDSFKPQLHGLPEAASSLAVHLHFVEILEDAKGYEAAFESMAKAGVHALLVPTSPRFNRDRRAIMELAARRRLPTVYDFGSIAIEGGLMGYGPTQAEMDRQAAKFVHKILNGAEPGDLPLEQPSKFELVINLKTAKTLGLTIPPSLLLRADQVIE
jgi:putative tryptophan/tyrosine transport system substrate-binding protein